jgi:hypothetical protein
MKVESEPLRVRIARIVAGHVTREQWKANPSEHKHNLAMADEILFEMRNPNDGIIEAVVRKDVESEVEISWRDGWETMIDAARGPGGK